MANAYEKLVAAGAPAIVEPLFYRISESGLNGTIHVEIRERAQYKGSNLKARRSVAPGEDLTARVVEAAQAAHEEIILKAEVESLVGVASSEGRDDV